MSTIASQVQLDNVSHQLGVSVQWTPELVNLCFGDVLVDRVGFGTFSFVSDPNSHQCLYLLINALNAQFQPALSMAFDYDTQRSPALRNLTPVESPWSEDGVIVGYIPQPEERGQYEISQQIKEIAEQLILILSPPQKLKR